MERLFDKILVANRSEIAVRILNACRMLDIPSVAVYSDADVNSRHKFMADEAVYIGPPPPRESYLDISRIIEAAKETGCDAIHPGYGFLAENCDFAKRCAESGLTFIGPTPEAILLLGNKVESRAKMSGSGIPLIPGMEGTGNSLKDFQKAANKVGYPVMVKAASGGGGKGMRIVGSPGDLEAAVEAARREALSAFNDDTVYVEKYIVNPRHIEFQILADSHGNTIHLFERECSIQRRHQKIIEETPSVAVNDELRARMGADAVKVAKTVGYTNAGTVEFLLDDSGHYYFLEMNTRIQVEHPITEMTTGVDLVAEQIRIAAGKELSVGQSELSQRGHAIECRIYAEDGENNFMPSIGEILHYSEPSGPGVRVDSGISRGAEISVDYDPIMAKLIVHAPNRESAIHKMIEALNAFKILGVKTSKRFMIDVLTNREFAAGRTFTDFIDKQMSDRKTDRSRLKELAVAVASLGAATCSSPSGQTAGIDAGRVDNVSQQIGGWRIGDSIDE